MKIRLARAEDIPLAGEAHIESCLDVYRGMVPDEYLDREMPVNLRRIWAGERLEGGDFIVMADADGAAQGLVTVRAGEPAYIDHFHVRPAMRSRGIGQQMMRMAVEEMRRRGVRGVYLTVLEVNEGAIRFYRSIGGEIGERVQGDLFGRPSNALKVRWPDLDAVRL